jgi:hypothetical protein
VETGLRLAQTWLYDGYMMVECGSNVVEAGFSPDQNRGINRLKAG